MPIQRYSYITTMITFITTGSWMMGQQYAQFMMRLLECFGGKSGGEEVHKHAKRYDRSSQNNKQVGSIHDLLITISFPKVQP